MKYKHIALVVVLFIFITIQNSCKSMKYADLILINGKIITVNNEFTISEGVAVNGNKIIAVGSNNEMKKLSGLNTHLIDLHGRTVIPGLIDSHLHPESASESEMDEKIPDVRNMEQLLGWIKIQTKIKSMDEWIILQKFFPTRLTEMRQPKLSELDSVSPLNPVFLNGSFGGMVNSKALQMAGINASTIHPGILKDPKSGAPTGFIRSSAFDLFKVPDKKALTLKEKEDALAEMLKRYNEYGLTSLISGAGDPESMNIYRDMANKKMLTARICQNILLPEGGQITKESVTEKIKHFTSITGEGDEWVRTGSLKILLDGGILTGTAYLNEPWGIEASKIFGIEDPLYKGVVNYSREELTNIVSVANELGWSFTAHATGEAAVDLLLDVFDDINRIKSIKDGRFSIIHGNFYNNEAIKKMAGLRVYANMQPAWFYKDAVAMDSILGRGKVKIFHPYRTMTDAGIVINGGSDHMVKWDANSSINPYNPFLAMWTMVTRKTVNGSIIMASEAISREEALKTYTINNAFATNEEAFKGSIEPGKLADLAVLSADILTCPADSIKEIKCLMTILDGKVIYTSTDPF